MSSKNADNNDSVRRYYSDTESDYRQVWLDPANLSMHFGFHDGPLSSHKDALVSANRSLAESVAIRPGDVVLDAGCGLGGSSFWLAENRGVQSVGIALGEDQIAQNVAEAERRRLQDRVRFAVADFNALPFPDGTFDVVWAQESLCHSPTKERFYREAYRVLRPAGRIVIADFILRSDDIRNFEAIVVAEWLRGWSIPGLWTARQHIEAASIAGFNPFRIEDVTRQTVASHRRLHGRSILAFPAALAMRAIGIRNPVQHANVVASLRQYEALRNGSWFYGLLTGTRPADPQGDDTGADLTRAS